MDPMQTGYGQFCPIAKGAEVLASRWTPLILRELMSDSHSFNDIHRGVPLISRAVLVGRLRELEAHDVVERRRRDRATGHEYWLTPAGEALRRIIAALGEWGLAHARDRRGRSATRQTVARLASARQGGRPRLPGGASGRVECIPLILI
jgi:DNA-binding HxlR family transcriptional regulator